MEKTQKALIIVSIFLVVALLALTQIWLGDQREKAEIEQARVLQEKYDEGFNVGLIEQFTDDEKIILGQQNIITQIIKAIKNNQEVKINTDEGLIILIEKLIEE